MPADDLQNAFDFAAKAQGLDDEDSDVHRLYAAVGLLRNDFEMTRRHQEKALQLNPNDDLIVVQQGEYLTWTGAPEEGVEWIKKAMALNPYHPERFWGHLGRAHFVAQQYAEAIECYRNLSNVDSQVHASLAAAMAGEGDEAGAKRHGAEVLKQAPDFTISDHLATLHYQHQADADHHRQMLRLAGLPD